MAFLSIFSATVVAEPHGMWEWLLLRLFSFIGNYGWRVVFFTVCLKLLLSPLDIFQRYKARKNQLITEQLKPQMEKLQKQYPDKTVFAQKQMQLQKQAGFSYFSSCLPALLTMVIMFWLFFSLNQISQYMNFKEYCELYDVYNAAVEEYNGYDDEAKAALKEAGVITDERKNAGVDEKVQFGQRKVYDYYQEHKTSFLWIKNIWSPDVPWKKEVNTKENFKTNIGKRASEPGRSGLSTEDHAAILNAYDNVMGLLLDDNYNGANGYLVLPILSVLLSVATQLLSMRQQKKSGQANDTMGGSMKIMMFIMPILIGWFSLSYTAAFALYLVVNYVFSLAIMLSGNLIFYCIDRREKKKQLTVVHKYGRPDPNDKNVG